MHEIWNFGQALLKLTDVHELNAAFRAEFENKYWAAKGTHYKDVLQHILSNSHADNWFRCNLNGIDCWLPRDTLRMMKHCVYDRLDESILVMIEGRHTQWMMERLDSQGLYVDIGSFSGAMVIPFATAYPDLKVYAFEPARRAYARLENTIKFNALSNVHLYNIAISDSKGITSFAEINDLEGHDNAPEGSSILHSNKSLSINHSDTTDYDVEIDTLDNLLFGAISTAQRSVIKIDVEGFEVNVLRGGRLFIEKHLPALSIDIHLDPFGSGETEVQVRDFLSPFGYDFARLDHVLVCDPLHR